MAGLDVRPPAVDDLPTIGQLYLTVKGHPRPDSVTRHRFFDTPWGDSVALIAVAGDQCVGLIVYWPVMMRIGGELVLGGQATDAATHPDYRRPRLFLSLAKAGRDLTRERGMELLYGFPNVRTTKLPKHINGTILGDVSAWGLAMPQRRLRLPRRAAPGEMEVGQPDAPELAALVARAHSEHDVVRIDKSPAWLAWRYSELTCERYEWLTLRDDSGALTAAALLGERDPASWGHDFEGIVRVHELFAADEAAARQLLRHSVEHVRNRGGRKLDILAKDPVLERAAESAGLRREEPHPVAALSHGTRALAVDPFDFGAWRLISGDMDFF